MSVTVKFDLNHLKNMAKKFNFDYLESITFLQGLKRWNIIFTMENEFKSSYSRLFYDGTNAGEAERIGNYHTTIHSDKIKAGNQLEKDICIDFKNNSSSQFYSKKNVEDFPTLKRPCLISACRFSKKWYQSLGLECKNKKSIEIDFVYISDDGNIHLFEIKNGCNFDTKKSKGEAQSLEATKNGCLQSGFSSATCNIVCYDAKKLKDVSLKTELGDVKILLYKDFCNIIGLVGDKSRARIELQKQSRAQIELQKVLEFVQSHPAYIKLQQENKALRN